MTNEEIIKIGSAITSIAVAANTIYTIVNENTRPKLLPEPEKESSPLEALDFLTINRL